MNSYIKLLKTSKNFAIISLVQLVCYFGAWFSHTGIFTLLIELKAPIWAITATAAIAFLPGIILAPFSGILIDKVRPKPVLILLILIECISVFMLIFINSLDFLWLLLSLVFIRMGVGGVFFQIEMSVLPKILSKNELRIANEIHSVIWALSYTAGMALAGIYIHFFGIKSAFLFDFFLYVFGFFVLLRLQLPNELKNIGNGLFAMLKEGFLYIKNKPLILHLIILHGFVGITAYDALIALLADNEYKGILSTALLIGLTNTARAFGLIIGPSVLTKYIKLTNIHYFFYAHGIGIAIWAFLQYNFYLGFIGMFCAGFFTNTLWSYTYTLIQHNCDEKFYGRIIAYNDMVYMGVSAIISALIGFLYKNGISLFAITIFMAVLFFLGAFYYKFIYKNYKLD